MAPYVEAVTARVLSVLKEPSRDLPELDAELPTFLAPARDLLAGGKRTRARLALEGWRSAGGAVTHEAAVIAGSALELFQAAALVHDDIIDAADTRRGMPAAHVRFAAAHTQFDGVGAADHFGQSAALLLGDLLLVLAQAEMSRAVRLADAPGAEEVWRLMTAEVAIGQYLDVRASHLPLSAGSLPAALDAALRVVRHKSARYSVEHPLAFGAALARADERLMAALRAFGTPLGEAFQLRDDDLGIFGDPAVTGKPAGDDLLEGKRTPLILLGMEMAAPADREALRGHLGDRSAGSAGVQLVREILLRSGAVERHEGMIAQLRARSLAVLAGAPLAPEARGRLAELADALTRRHA